MVSTGTGFDIYGKNRHIFPKSITENCKKFIAIWEGMKGREAVPYKKSLNPMDFKDFLSNIALYERVSERSLRFKLISAYFSELNDKNYTDEDVFTLFNDEDKEVLLSRFSEFAEAKCGFSIIARHNYAGQDPLSFNVYTLLLPLLDDKGDAKYWIVYLCPLFKGEITIDEIIEKKAGKTLSYSLTNDLHFVDIGTGTPASIHVNR